MKNNEVVATQNANNELRNEAIKNLLWRIWDMGEYHMKVSCGFAKRSEEFYEYQKKAIVSAAKLVKMLEPQLIGDPKDLAQYTGFYEKCVTTKDIIELERDTRQCMVLFLNATLWYKKALVNEFTGVVLESAMKMFEKEIVLNASNFTIKAFWEPEDDGSGVYVVDYEDEDGVSEVNINWDGESFGVIWHDKDVYDELPTKFVNILKDFEEIRSR